MTFNEFAQFTFRMPAKILAFLVGLIIGDRVRRKDGTIDEGKTSPSLFGLILDIGRGILNFGKAIGKGITGFLRNQEGAIATAFWMSLLLGGAAALTVAYWPAALNFVVNFNIAGYSIASLVGADFVAQVAATAGVTVLATSALVYATALVAGIVGFIARCFTCNSADDEPGVGADAGAFKYDAGTKAEPDNEINYLNEPVHTKSLFQEHKAEPNNDSLERDAYLSNNAS
jgi:hypothetical protein